ncbi:MAG: hypothetical protein KJ579_03195 [Verrucomicrobia bacterium]|nr:hypothetical protein [Verrucomicrobiota bacterium]
MRFGACFGLWISCFPASAAGWTVDADYPGGNIVVERIENGTATVRPDLRDTQKGQWWFYWNLRIRGAAGESVRIRFPERNPIGARGPAVSLDGGTNWAWLGANAVTRIAEPKAWEFAFAVPSNAPEVRFSMTVPYQESDLLRFLVRHRGNPALVRETLCRTPKGRDAELLRAGALGRDPEMRVLLTTRHHACESLASFALEGILESVLADDAVGRAWRERVEVMAVPFVDKDGVEDGDQGKNRAPRDHNRDYVGESVHATVAAIRKQIPRWSGGRLRFALDLHCPYLSGGDTNERIYFPGPEDAVAADHLAAFSTLLAETRRGPLPYSPKHNIPFGTAWNTTGNYGAGRSFSRWVRDLPGIGFANTMEIPYANAGGAEVNADSARALGRDLARAIAIHLGLIAATAQ